MIFNSSNQFENYYQFQIKYTLLFRLQILFINPNKIIKSII
jgi:hypothetical protein